MKNKTEVSRTDVCVRVVKGALEAVTGVNDKIPASPSPLSPSTPLPSPLSPSTPAKIKCESPTVFLGAHTPPPTGPGAEVRGKPGTPIASASSKAAARPNSANSAAEDKAAGGAGGGRLTFFKEGKFLLELSHRTEMGAPAGWVPVKSKTYWPPPSSTTTTTTQHPLRHDTPTSQSVSDDCSSLNSSPWTSDHIRKQPLPRPARGPAAPAQAATFWFHCPPEARAQRRRLPVGRRRRNPLLQAAPGEKVAEKTAKVESKVDGERKVKVEGEGAVGKGAARLEKLVRLLWVGLRVEADVSLHNALEQRGGGGGGGGEALDPTFVSPRKRYLRQMETDQDVPTALHRKKLHAAGLPQAPGDRPAGMAQIPTTSSSSSSASPYPSSLSSPGPASHRGGASVLAPSVYSIDSILNHEGAGGGAGVGIGTATSRQGDSFLRTLLKPEVKAAPPRARERPPDPPHPPSVKAERDQSGPDRGDALLEMNRRPSPERYDLSRYGPVAGLYPLGPYMDPRYMLMHSLAPGLVGPAAAAAAAQSSDMAQALAAATAAAAAAASLGTYPIGPLPPPLPGAQYYYPPTSVAAQLLRQPSLASRCSPHPPASPSPKTHQYPPPTPASPHLSRGASPRGRASPWQPPPPPAHPLSPHPSLASPLPSPPPQDAPLNLSKPRNHLGK
ncbi:proline-rich protein 36-like [Portunus trituberculatus]|uniref:proline-rich protein 36-like n=1 Tax=Portunus trituberculatus TaxID=210409 RepID=UPI001E1CEC7E|nr:proline-rich protein 36-like [Portunus trituberculatus]